MKKMKMKKKMKMGYFKDRSFASRTLSLSFKASLEHGRFIFKYTQLILPISDFRSYTNLYGKQNNLYHPYIESTTILSDTSYTY